VDLTEGTDMFGLAPHKEDIKAAIRKRYGSVVQFEKAHNLPTNSVRDVLRGRAVTNTARVIARELGMTTEQLFPGRFKSHNGDYSQRDRNAHRQNGKAA